MNIGSIHFQNREFKKAALNFKGAAKMAAIMCEHAKQDQNEEEFKRYSYLYCKRKYFEAISHFKYAHAQEDSLSESEWKWVEKKLAEADALMQSKVRSSEDIRIHLRLATSFCCRVTRRLISAEREMNYALKLFKRMGELDEFDRPGIAIPPREIIKQRVYLQKGLIELAYQ